MEPKTDLRKIKTQRAIKQAFAAKICVKTVNKITVAELAQEAEINKGTFYLHYTDMYALYHEVLAETVDKIAGKFNPYPAFFTAPESFVREFLFSSVAPPSKLELALLQLNNLKFSTNYPHVFIHAFRQKIYAVGKLVPCLENDIKLEFILTGMFSLLLIPEFSDRTDATCADFIVSFSAGVIRQAFPAFYDPNILA